MTVQPPVVRQMLGGEISAWIEQGTSIHLKAVSATGDPVELTFDEARELGRLLIKLADEAEEAERAD